METILSKNELRRKIRSSKREATQEELVRQSSEVVAILAKHPLVLQANTIMAYMALPDEVNVDNLIRILIKQGKRVVVPVVDSQETMHVVLCSEKDIDMPERGSFGIREPQSETFYDLNDINLAIVPGMAFDIDGHRLGRGKGYYDRFLSSLPHCTKIGTAFKFQILENVPYNEHDIMMNEVVFCH